MTFIPASRRGAFCHDYVKPYRDQSGVDAVLRQYGDKLYTFISSQGKDDEHIRDIISIALVWIAQRGNMSAKQEIIKLLSFTIDDWIDRNPNLSCWRGYDPLIQSRLECCIRCYRFVDKSITSRLIEPDSIEKIFIIDDHIGCATSGLVADARSLIDRARLDAQINEITYSEKIQVETLVKRICDFKQTYTQYGGVRPFGTALLIAGVDQTGASLFSTDPSGALMEYKAASEGAGRTGAMAYFEEHYKENISVEEAVDLGLKALHKGTEGKLNPDAIEIGVVKKGVKFHILSSAETKAFVTKTIGGK